MTVEVYRDHIRQPAPQPADFADSMLEAGLAADLERDELVLQNAIAETVLTKTPAGEIPMRAKESLVARVIMEHPAGISPLELIGVLANQHGLLTSSSTMYARQAVTTLIDSINRDSMGKRGSNWKIIAELTGGNRSKGEPIIQYRFAQVDNLWSPYIRYKKGELPIYNPLAKETPPQQTAPESLEDRLNDLARRVSDGNVEAFESLYESHIDTIYRYVYYKVGNGQLAEDLTQQIFMKAWEAINRYQWRELPFQHWLLRLARNTVIDHYRSTKPANASLLDQAGDFVDPEQELLQSEQIQTLQETVQQLPDEQREVIVLRFIEQMPHADIARRLGKSAATVRVIQHRALQALRRLLEQKKEPNVKGNSAGQRRLASILNSIRESTI